MDIVHFSLVMLRLKIQYVNVMQIDFSLNTRKSHLKILPLSAEEQWLISHHNEDLHTNVIHLKWSRVLLIANKTNPNWIISLQCLISRFISYYSWDIRLLSIFYGCRASSFHVQIFYLKILNWITYLPRTKADVEFMLCGNCDTLVEKWVHVHILV